MPCPVEAHQGYCEDREGRWADSKGKRERPVLWEGYRLWCLEREVIFQACEEGKGVKRGEDTRLGRSIGDPSNGPSVSLDFTEPLEGAIEEYYWGREVKNVVCWEEQWRIRSQAEKWPLIAQEGNHQSAFSSRGGPPTDLAFGWSP